MFSITILKSVAGDTLALELESIDALPIFDIRLGLDIYPEKIDRILEEMSSVSIPAVIDSSNCCNFPPMETVQAVNFFFVLNILISCFNLKTLISIGPFKRQNLIVFWCHTRKQFSAETVLC